ncbi:endolytic transglycosylase MltG [Fictibacillus sp. b24]|uniref:endolytic transglycosylase MltG n=1 Tax=Fictibacillus sp. b24 TaxID=3055863 RepID=UPI0025A2398B|nr:endolytic transglycosylase MltG [Fictibacillus sp. b24]MDM5315521.1 endolytic transglycosylase MltG [Fictibacillus sp. b24]
MNTSVKIILIIFFTIFVIFAGWIIYAVMPAEGSAEKPFIVKESSDFSSLSRKLKNEGFVKNPFLFNVYSTITGKKEKIATGEHTIKQGANYKEILADLSTLSKETEADEVVVPEGLTVIEMADRLSQKGIVDREAFLNKAKTWNTLTKEQQEQLKFNDEELHQKVKYAVEGLLYPDTYFFEKKMDEGDVIRQMIDRMIEKTANIRMTTDQTPYEMITLASIIEEEALLNKEKRTIAGVFINRIRDGKKLQSCSTVQYLLDKPKAALRRKDLKIKSPYNTYLNEGLPPSPIASPDLTSLKAAADPEKHDYYYFLAKQDGTWSHYFSKTYKQHRKYTQLSGNY